MFIIAQFTIAKTWRQPKCLLTDERMKKNLTLLSHKKRLPCGSAGKEASCDVGDLGLNPGLRRSPGEGKGYLLQFSGLENSMDCIGHAVAKSWTWQSTFHLTAMRKKEVVSCAATQMDLEIITLRDASQTEKDRYMWYHLQMASKIRRKWTKPDSQKGRPTCGCQGGGVFREFGIDMNTQLYLKWITNKLLL